MFRNWSRMRRFTICKCTLHCSDSLSVSLQVPLWCLKGHHLFNAWFRLYIVLRGYSAATVTGASAHAVAAEYQKVPQNLLQLAVATAVLRWTLPFRKNLDMHVYFGKVFEKNLISVDNVLKSGYMIKWNIIYFACILTYTDLSRSCPGLCSVKVAATDEAPPTKPILSESSGFSQWR